MLAKIVQGRNAHFVWEAFVGFNVVFINDQRVHVLKRAADLQGPVTFGGKSLLRKGQSRLRRGQSGCAG